MAPRIAPVSDPGPDIVELLSKTLIPGAETPFNIFTTLANHPSLLRRFNVFAGLFMAHGELPPRERELVILRTAFHSGSEYEWGQHVLIARRVGVTEEEINALTLAVTAYEWSRPDAAILRFTDELLETVDVSDEVWSETAQYFSTAQLIELTMLGGLYRMIAGFLVAARVQREAGLPHWPDQARPLTDPEL
jgi:4-carboxymuconolactone decarboxylase